MAKPLIDFTFSTLWLVLSKGYFSCPDKVLFPRPFEGSFWVIFRSYSVKTTKSIWSEAQPEMGIIFILQFTYLNPFISPVLVQPLLK